MCKQLRMRAYHNNDVYILAHPADTNKVGGACIGVGGSRNQRCSLALLLV